tara:strand:+ start:282 stop:1019 length:738 start_codon:yes stop_codon:yes gene_type:complete
LLLAFLTSCATKIKYSAIQDKDQSLKFADGKEVLVSTKENSTAAISCTPAVVAIDERLICQISILSNHKNDINFSPENIDFIVSSQKLNVVPYSVLLQEIEDERENRKLAAALSNVSANINAQNAARSQQNHYGSYGGSSGYGNYYGTTTTYDPAKAMALQNQNNRIFGQNLKSADVDAENSVAELRGYLRKTTLPKGEVFSRYFKLNKILRVRGPAKYDNSPVIIKVAVGSELHTFKLKKEKLK